MHARSRGHGHHQHQPSCVAIDLLICCLSKFRGSSLIFSGKQIENVIHVNISGNVCILDYFSDMTNHMVIIIYLRISILMSSFDFWS